MKKKTALLPCAIDHLVVTAPTLDIGTDWVQERLGVTLLPGGEHPAMGTHNWLLRLGENSYLEVIAVNPAAPKPDRLRWFGLDALSPASPPRLAAWVASTPDIETTVCASAMPLGAILQMQRGALRWRITVPDDGMQLLDGFVPAVIEWTTQPHPAAMLPDSGCSLLRLEGFHSQRANVRAALESIRADGLLELHSLPASDKPRLVAHLLTPGGTRVLGDR